MHDGIAIALAWPQTLCKKAGAWYDKPMKWLGFLSNSNYYKVGHAAVVLVNKATGKCHYFDFGRYHTPYQYGRVRSSYTDHELEIKTKALIEKQQLINYRQIIGELHKNSSCHGSGEIHASYCEVNFEKAYKKAYEMQIQSPIKYGPFLPQGTNCSRFVNTIILKGNPKWFYKFFLWFTKIITPSPKAIVKVLENYLILKK